ncbi:alpha-amylase family glycosyl hydrolase [Butyrivibrio sp. VCD2006]|uniref:alpha-amylase family glycosyl hydrolase n=1 Tax=Butyrivibrio sp. VCD2006 TaxID=1280664 RepID=UPI0003F831CC|nr:alpha-amylase family glycosyl hydrolase [Butyrivibrio sp. VCD2006]
MIDKNFLLKFGTAALISSLIVPLDACGNKTKNENNDSSASSSTQSSDTFLDESVSNDASTDVSSDESVSSEASADASSNTPLPVNVIDDAYRTTYEIFVYSFYDSDGDGIGDLQGVINKLDYINDGDASTTDDLGCNEIWLMPICPSTTYHKYDVIDYCDVDPEYGTIDDYKELLTEAHKRGIRIINDMVMNHSSTQHKWFKEAVDYLKNLPEGAEPDSAECPYVDYYHFSKEAQTGYEKLPGIDWYYECRFWSEMPDLDLDNEAVQQEFADIAKFWLELGCDGFRMDALTAFTTDDIAISTDELTPFVKAVKGLNPDAYIVGEAWTNSASYAKFYASGIDSLFDFDYSGSEGTIAKCAKGKLNPTKYVQQQIDEDELFSAYNANYINAPFYTNHDMARSAGYYTGKTATQSTKLAGALNLLMSGNAFIYYGEELGMKGSGKDENKRAPMPWDSEGSEGMTTGPKDIDKINQSNGTYADQKDDPDSIFNYYKKAIGIRNAYPAIARGKCSILDSLSGNRFAVWKKDATSVIENPDIEDQVVIIILNNDKESVEIDLSKDSSADGFRSLGASLSTGADEAVLDGDILTVPSFGIAVLTVSE